jgi:hypothetical protein
MFVVHMKNSGELIGMYQKASSAKAQATRHNRKLTMALLSEQSTPWRLMSEESWAVCTWAEYESTFFKWYATSNRFGYRGYL